MVSLLSSPAMPTIQHYYLLFYLYKDVRVWGSRGLTNHIRILPFQLCFSSLLGFGGCLVIIMSQVPSQRSLAEMMVFKHSTLQDTTSRASRVWRSLWIHIDAELQPQLWLGHPAGSHSCESYSDNWPKLGAGRSEAEIHADLIPTAPVLFTAFRVPVLSGSPFPFI